MQTDFRRANRIGDRLRIVCEHDGNGNGRRCWSYSGRIGEVEYFSIRSLPGGDPEPASAAARPADPAFIGEAETVGAWASGIGGQLQLFRYFELLSDAIEQWFEALLDVPFRHLHMERRVGIPTVRFTTHCRALPRIGDTVSIGIRPDAVGNSSLRFTSWLLSDGECLIENRQVIVFVERAEDRIGSMPIPADVRERLTAQLAASGGGADD